MKKNVVVLTMLIWVSACESPPPRVALPDLTPHELVNLYHNVHYNNPGFYPNGYYYNGGFQYMRGYRY